MLLIGTVVSLVTAVFATRAMLGLLAGFRWFDNPRFMGATAQEIPRWQRSDVVGRRRLWFILSLVAIGVSIVALVVQGLNLGIDFKGGVQVTFTTPKADVALGRARPDRRIGHGDASSRAAAAPTGTAISTRASRSVSRARPRRAGTTDNTLETTQAASSASRTSRRASAGRSCESAIYAIIVSFALIALFVTLRYQWRFAVPILRTLVNDVLITLGIYAISGREVSASTVAAILTILGYSIYDTIIVFDRVRENMQLMPRATIARIATSRSGRCCGGRSSRR